MSDTHGLIDAELVGRLAHLCPEVILHAGDVGRQPNAALPVLAELATIAPVLAVPGNTDGPCHGAARHAVYELALTAAGSDKGRVTANLLMLHGNAPTSIKNASKAPLAVSPEAAGLIARSRAAVVYFGHSHVPGLGVLPGTEVAWINPGSAGPQRFKLPRSFGLLRVSPGRAAFSIERLCPGAGELRSRVFAVSHDAWPASVTGPSRDSR